MASLNNTPPHDNVKESAFRKPMLNFKQVVNGQNGEHMVGEKPI
jgi:hypothetical protein